MFLYKSTVGGFQEDVDSNTIVGLIELAFERQLGRKIPPAERDSMTNSLSFMERGLIRLNRFGIMRWN